MVYSWNAIQWQEQNQIWNIIQMKCKVAQNSKTRCLLHCWGTVNERANLKKQFSIGLHLLSQYTSEHHLFFLEKFSFWNIASSQKNSQRQIYSKVPTPLELLWIAEAFFFEFELLFFFFYLLRTHKSEKLRNTIKLQNHTVQQRTIIITLHTYWP